MRIVFLIILLSLPSFGCNKKGAIKQNDKQNQFKIFSFRKRGGGEFVSKDTFQKQDIKNDSCWAFYYKTKNNKLDFKLFVSKKEPINGLIKYDSDSTLYHYDFVDSKFFDVNNKSYEIIKLSYSHPPRDGEHDIYFCNNFGLLGLESRAWYNWTEFKCLNDSINQIITCLQTQMYKDIIFYWDLECDNKGDYKRKK